MSLEQTLFAALSTVPSLARAGGYFAVNPVTFPQPVRYSPEWPALRYTFISEVPPVDICGDGDDSTTDVRVQLDVVATTFAGARSLRLEVLTAMSLLYPPAILETSSADYDEETNTYRCVLDYLVQPSSTIGSP